jgi:hypothetical protein
MNPETAKVLWESPEFIHGEDGKSWINALPEQQRSTGPHLAVRTEYWQSTGISFKKIRKHKEIWNEEGDWVSSSSGYDEYGVGGGVDARSDRRSASACRRCSA